MIKEASSDFHGDIAEGNVLVMISTPGCGPCGIMKRNVLPFLENIDIITVDATKQMDPVNIVQASSGPIQSVPVCVLYKNGSIVKRKDGGMSLEEAQEFVESE